MLWHFRANLQEGSENFATHLWQCELEDVEPAQAHMGKLSKNIVPSSIFIACTVKILYPLLLKKLFLWDCSHSSSQLKNHQAVRRTLEDQTTWLTPALCTGPTPLRCSGPVDQAAGMGLWAVGPVPLAGELPFTRVWGVAAVPVPGQASPGRRLEVLAPPRPVPPVGLAVARAAGLSGSPRLMLGTVQHGAAASLHPDSDSPTH